MNKFLNIAIVVVLAAAVAAVVALKENKPAEPTNDIPAAIEKTQEAVSQTSPQVVGRLIDLGADKCIPCKMMAPILEEIKKDYEGKLEVIFIDVWKNPDEAGKYGIRVIPTQIFYDAAGKEFYRHEGFFSKEDILSKFREKGLQ